jgi:hypothetical protein
MRDPKDTDRIFRPTPGADPVRQANGHIYGLRSAASMTPEQRSNRSTIAGNTILRQYGVGYYSALGKLSAKKNRQNRDKA